MGREWLGPRRRGEEDEVVRFEEVAGGWDVGSERVGSSSSSSSAAKDSLPFATTFRFLVGLGFEEAAAFSCSGGVAALYFDR